jgi:hypothetical protein
MKILLLTILAFVSLQLTAQNWVQVPDANFQTYLTAHYPAAAFMTSGGNFFVDSDHAAIQAEDSIIVQSSNIVSLEGIQAFENLLVLDCTHNYLTSLPVLPATLTILHCRYNQLTVLPSLPGSLGVLVCNHNQLTAIPALPASLNLLEVSNNFLTALPALPNSLGLLVCTDNQLTSFPSFPISLNVLYCSRNPISALPALPGALSVLECDSCQLSSLPLLPSSLITLSCNYNSLTTLPALPELLNTLWCARNQLSELPELSDSILNLDCSYNQIHCFHHFPERLQNLLIDGNPFTCLPNYRSSNGMDLLSYPLCADNDPVNNPNGCVPAAGMQGTVFYDENNDCISTGQTLTYVPMTVYDANGVLISSSTSLANGNYFFTTTPGTYELSIDTANLISGVEVTCPVGNSSIVTVPVADTVVSGEDFGLMCNGYDLGVQSIVHYGWVFPGETHELSILAGDLAAQYNMHCASGISGEVTIAVTGPGVVAFGGSPTTITGNTAVYSIADFGALNASQFLSSVLTNTNATHTDQFCISVTVSTTASGELNTANNTYTYCYHVVNSYDPNIKETYPEVVASGYQDEFTYTIHFQNTGNAPAMNIRLVDDLDYKLDPKTFKVVQASHQFTTDLDISTGLVFINFPNIMLADSTSDPEGSIGFVQYRVKPIPGLMNGTTIYNIAYIYFDYNAPIVTNMTENVYAEPAGLNELADETVQLYPNPSDNLVFIRSENSVIEQVMFYDLNGMLVKTMSPNSKQTSVDVSGLESGVYFATIQTNQSVIKKRLIVR